MNQRRRNESVSSVSGSWQMVTGTGSFRSPEPPQLAAGANGTKLNESFEDDGMKEILIS